MTSTVPVAVASSAGEAVAGESGGEQKYFYRKCLNVKYFSPGIAGVPRWVLGVAVGVPVAAALIYILFGPSSDDEKKKTKKTGSKKTTPVKAPAPATAAPKPIPVQEKKTEEVVFHPTSSSAILTNIKTWFQVAVEDVEEEPADPLEKATAAKNRGNKYFKGGRYELAINCYTEAIEVGHHLI